MTTPAQQELRMAAYYYSFEPTGAPEIDRILSAVACAGKAFHHTESWGDESGLPDGHTGDTPVAWISNAAASAAAELRSARAGEEQAIRERDRAVAQWRKDQSMLAALESDAIDLVREVERWREHIKTCPAHLMRAVEADPDGLRAALPPLPPDGSGLPRYGLRWNGPERPVPVPMEDGYWTPYHLAAALADERDEARAEVERLKDEAGRLATQRRQLRAAVSRHHAYGKLDGVRQGLACPICVELGVNMEEQ